MVQALNKVIYLKRNQIGFFGSSLTVKNAFSWGKQSRNMSFAYSKRPKFVQKRIDKFLHDSNMSSQHDSISLITQGEDKIIYIDENKYNSGLDLLYNNFPQRGFCVEGDTIFTSVKGIPLIVKPGDCAVSIIEAVNAEGRKIVGLIHTGTSGMILGLARKSMQYLHDKLQCDLSKVKICIAPSIRPESYSRENWKNILMVLNSQD